MGLRVICGFERLGLFYPWCTVGMGTSENPVHSYYPFYYVNGNGAEMGIFDRLRESAGANASLGRKSVYASQGT